MRQSLSTTTLALTESEEQALIEAARAAITQRLNGRGACVESPLTPSLLLPCGAFVTLKVNGGLRGCIGRITASRPLLQTVREVAQCAAFEDPRFAPLTPAEWPAVRLEISVLSPFRKITDVQSIEVGVHGVMIRCGHHSGLLLPQVATEQGWDRDMFLRHVCSKAGLPPDAWKSPLAQIEIFSALVIHEKD
ncbi:MAG TPA: AmmeMemoRadiSam system protein A [Spirochaetia bacterium]|nr:AmmeMemoRadiSam system protein A [Spirochaetia bacterium]